METLTTYYVASWADLSAGEVPSGPVEEVVCSAAGCTTQLQEWGTQEREVTLTTTQTVQFQAQITGVSCSPYQAPGRNFLIICDVLSSPPLSLLVPISPVYL